MIVPISLFQIVNILLLLTAVCVTNIDANFGQGFTLNIRDQIIKNKDNIFKLDQTQYKFINQLTKLQDDINDLEEDISKFKTMVTKMQNLLERNHHLNNRPLSNVFHSRSGSSLNNPYMKKDAEDVFYIFPTDGFVWKIESVSSFWNKSGAQLVSKRFYTEGQYGYKIRLKLDNPFGKIRVVVDILKGEFDSFLPWPFNNEVEVSLLSQDYPYKHYTVHTLFKPDTCLHRALESMKRYSHVYSVQLREILFHRSKPERDYLVIDCQFNDGIDLDGEKIFNKKVKWKVEKFFSKIKHKDYKPLNYSFYTGDFGYKLQLVLYPNGVSDNGELNLFLTVLDGEYDNFLWWPFKYNVTIKILNGNETKNMCPTEMKTKYNRRQPSELAGFIFFNKSEIQSFYPSLIKDDRMFIKFKTKPTMSYIFNTDAGNKMEETYPMYINWTINNVDTLRKQSTNGPSKIFSLSQVGYHIKLSAFLNGERIAQGRYASLFIYVVNGSYDHILPWPFSRKLSLAILDENLNGIGEERSVIQNTLFKIPVKPFKSHGLLVGYSRFMELTSTNIRKFVRNDILRIQLRILPQ